MNKIKFVSRRGNIEAEVEKYRDHTGEELYGIDAWRLLSHFERAMKQKDPDPTNYIYILIDPDDMMVKYVGKSNDPAYRYRAHVSDFRPNKHAGNGPKCMWIKGLMEQGKRPLLQVLCKCKKSESQNYEYRYFKLFNYDNNLLNSAIIQKETFQLNLF